MNNLKAYYKVLLVDDDTLTRTMYREKFETETEFQVSTARDGKEALELLRQEVFDLVFTGIDMPRLGGFELIDEMRLDPRLKHIPIMVSSHWGRPRDRKLAKSLGVKHFVVRGETTPNEVIHLMRRILITEKAEYSLELIPDSLDYQIFIETFFSSICAECQNKSKLPIKLILEKRGNQDLFSVHLSCNQCNQ